MANFLTLDKDDKPLGVVHWDLDTVWQFPNGCAKIIQYDGPYWPDATWDHVQKILIDSTPAPEPAPGAEPVVTEGEPVSVIA